MNYPKASKKIRDLNKIKQIVYKDIEKLLNHFDINYELINNNYYSTCPIHAGSDNKRAFSISSEKQQWRCWTRNCHDQYNKDIFGLVVGILTNKYGREVKFNEVLDTICKIYKIDDKHIKKDKPEESKEDEFSSIIKIFNKKENNKQTTKLENIKCNDISQYFIKRGFQESTLKYFEIKDCIDPSSKMRGRAIIPIHDTDKNTIAYIGRATKQYITPKFLFTQGFKKAEYLYNHHRALEYITKTSCLFILEGQGDVWKLYEAGINNCVSIFGKEISETQKNLIMNLNITTLVILTDNDQAGRESKFQIQRQFSRMFNLKFPTLSRKDVGDMTVEQIKKDILPQVKGLY